MPLLKPLAIIAGVGPGTGASLAARFGRTYTVALLARTSGAAEQILASIGGDGIAVATDVTDPVSIAAAFGRIREAYADRPLAAAVYNVASRVKKPFLELSLDEFESGWATGGRGPFLFSQHALPLLLTAGASDTAGAYTPSLIFTGATASVKANAESAAFATQKWAQRALAQSLAKEFGPRGVHVAHVIVDGPIDTPRIREMFKGVDEKGLIDPDAIADAYWWLHTQDKRALTWEVDLRTGVEKW